MGNLQMVEVFSLGSNCTSFSFIPRQRYCTKRRAEKTKGAPLIQEMKTSQLRLKNHSLNIESDDYRKTQPEKKLMS
jgi:hypothetical protein